MSYQFNEQFSAYTHQFAAVAARVNRLALENAETLFGVQLRTLEKNVDATTSYLGELAEARDLDAYRSLWPKGLQVARDNAERVAAAGQEVFGLTLKTTEALGQLAKSQFEAAADQAQATTAKATKTAKR
ncbi:MAG TPA: phasin family protein [Pseudoxanthomonas sp.]|nr:phasin family protein [Pseudoxanthomonas sp.]